ncbi:hypothetical protein D3C71_1917630 [compost metagenome]
MFRSEVGRPRSEATARRILCRADKPMVHCLRRVSPYGLWIVADRLTAAPSPEQLVDLGPLLGLVQLHQLTAKLITLLLAAFKHHGIKL